MRMDVSKTGTYDFSMDVGGFDCGGPVAELRIVLA